VYVESIVELNWILAHHHLIKLLPHKQSWPKLKNWNDKIQKLKKFKDFVNIWNPKLLQSNKISKLFGNSNRILKSWKFKAHKIAKLWKNNEVWRQKKHTKWQLSNITLLIFYNITSLQRSSDLCNITFTNCKILEKFDALCNITQFENVIL